MAQTSVPNEFETLTAIPSAGINENFSTMAAAYNVHDAATGSVHGVGVSEGAIVATIKAQNLTNKLECIGGLDITPTKGLVYKISSAGALSLASPTDTDIHKYALVVGTGVAGIAAFLGYMTGLTFGFSLTTYPAPQNLYLTASGVLSPTMPASGRIIVVAKMIISTAMLINPSVMAEELDI
jgi:hypothetical protein